MGGCGRMGDVDQELSRCYLQAACLRRHASLRPRTSGGRPRSSATSGSLAKRSPGCTFRRPSPGFAALRAEALSRPIPRQCPQTWC